MRTCSPRSGAIRKDMMIRRKSLLWRSLTLLACFHAFAKAIMLDCDPCIDREAYQIRAIVHGSKTETFWQQVQSAALQAGRDMRVQLEFDFYENQHSLMADEITKAATLAQSKSSDAPDALVVTIPSPEVEVAIKEANQHIPIFGMNSGYNRAGLAGTLGFVAMDGELWRDCGLVCFCDHIN